MSEQSDDPLRREDGRAIPRVRLRGVVDNTRWSFLLPEGSHTVGSRLDNDLVVPFQGVSGRHAQIEVDHKGILIEDLDSRNGTWVNGERIRQTHLAVGSRVRFGIGELVLERAPRDDIALAFSVTSSFPQGSDTAPEGTQPSTDFVAGRGLGSIPQALEVLSRLAELSLGPEGSSLAPALELVSRVLNVRSSCLYCVGGHDSPVVLSTFGAADHDKVAAFLELRADTPRERGHRMSLAVVTVPGMGMVTQVGLRTSSEPACIYLALDGVLPDFPGRGSLMSAFLRFTELRCREDGRLGPPTADRSPRRNPSELCFPEGFVQGRSPAWNNLMTELRLAISGGLSTLILGETGVGKEWIAKAFHASSRHGQGPFVPVNCAAIPSDLLEAEMFGVEKGAATDVSARKGRFQEADGGTLFLDEISELPLHLQAKLLRALQESEVQPLGGRPKKVDLDVLAATNVDLWQRVRSGEFRSDLFFRIAGAELRVPPLRERPADIPIFVEHFLRRCAERGRHQSVGVSVAAMNHLCHYSWPGNIRELETEMRRLAAACPPNGIIDEKALSARILASEGCAESPLDLRSQVARLERSLISDALVKAEGSQRQAARLLGVSRRGLSLKIQRLGISLPQKPTESGP